MLKNVLYIAFLFIVDAEDLKENDSKTSITNQAHYKFETLQIKGCYSPMQDTNKIYLLKMKT